MPRKIKTGDPESKFSQTVLKPSLEKFGGVRFKIADTFTKGIPDTVYSYLGHTYFIEAKVVERWDHVLTRIAMDKLQLITMWRLGYHSGNRAFYAIQCLDDMKVGLFRLTSIRPVINAIPIHISGDCDAVVAKMFG